MSAEDNTVLLHRYMSEVWDAGNPNAIEQFLAPNYQRHPSPTPEPFDRTEQLRRLKGFREAFPDIEIEVVDVIAGEDRVAFRSIMRGTHLGEYVGIAPTGRHVTVGLIDLIRIKDGKFVEQWGGPDLFDLLHQLGAPITATPNSPV